MKLFRRSLLAALALAATACNVAPEDAAAWEAEALASQTREATTALYNHCPGSIPAAPTPPQQGPTPLSAIPFGRALYPATAGLRSAYTVIVTDPSDSNLFHAFGFDVVTQRLHFYVTGEKRQGDLRRLNQQIANDIEVIEQTSGYDPGFTWGSSGQVGGPLIPKPVIHEGAWKVAFNNHYQLNDSLMPSRFP